MKRDELSIHEMLDTDAGETAASGPGEADLGMYREALSLLAECWEDAPPDLTRRVLTELPPEPDRRWRDRLRLPRLRRAPWLAPALAGALASLVAVVAVTHLTGGPHPDEVAVRFEVHAPDAHRVELVGSFNDWTPGRIVLKGPDATGYWSATVELPAGRYEYLYLVDGQRWVTDPAAPAHRPDGFGRQNALIEL